MASARPPAPPPSTPLTLRFLYLGSKDVEADLRVYRDALGGRVLWDFTDDGTRVAAVDVGPGPPVLLADHRPAPGCLLVYQVSALDAAAAALADRGLEPAGQRFEIPNGPCYVFKDASGNEFALFEDVRPRALVED